MYIMRDYNIDEDRANEIRAELEKHKEKSQKQLPIIKLTNSHPCYVQI